MSTEMIKIAHDFLRGIREDAETMIDMSETDGQLNEIIKILNECRIKLLDYRFGMLMEKERKV